MFDSTHACAIVNRKTGLLFGLDLFQGSGVFCFKNEFAFDAEPFQLLLQWNGFFLGRVHFRGFAINEESTYVLVSRW
jgi:hypothetical protein